MACFGDFWVIGSILDFWPMYKLINIYLTKKVYDYKQSSLSYALINKNRPSFLELNKPKCILTSAYIWGLSKNILLLWRSARISAAVWAVGVRR